MQSGIAHHSKEGLDAVSAGLRHYLRALWGRDFRLLTCVQPVTQLRPYLSELGIHLPPNYASHRGPLLRDLYRAAAAHAAAHDAFSQVRFERRKLKPVQLAIIALLEDARVEQLAIDAMPGLRRLWLQFFDPRGRDSTSVDALLLRLSHVLLDPSLTDDNPWVVKAKRLYLASQACGSDPQPLRELGILLGNDLGQMRAQFNAKSYLVEPLYRDDNVFLWDSDTPPESTRTEDAGFTDRDTATDVHPRFDEHASDAAHVRQRDVAAAANDTGTGNDDASLRYPEWDERIGCLRQHWCRIVEHVPRSVHAHPLHKAFERTPATTQRLAQALQARKRGHMQRLRRQPEGDEFEIDALVRAQLALRIGQPPDAGLYRRSRRQTPDLSVLLLLDLSQSTRAALGDATLLALIRQASVLLAEAIAQCGDRIAIHGFNSNGRHEVNYFRFKEFDEPLDDAMLGRLAAVEGSLSTRMGAAIRHASRLMRHCRSTQRLVLLLTDGEPHDIDVYQPGLLASDAAHAVKRSEAEGTPVFCLSVDSTATGPQEAGYLRQIFGPHHYLVLDRIEQLPQRLPALYLRLTQ